MNSKDIVIRTPYAKFLECIEFTLLQSAYDNGVQRGNHFYEKHIKSFATGAVNEDLAEFLQDQAANLDYIDIVNILDTPDYVFGEVSNVFFDAIRQVMGDSSNAKEWANDFRNYAHAKFDIFGKYYLFVQQYSNAGNDKFIIQADSMESAYEILLEEFETLFKVDEPEDETERENAELNGFGTYVNTDYLSYLGSIEFRKP